MNSKVKFSIFSLIAIVSTIVIALLSNNYLGIPFEIDYICLIFSFIEFVCICTACKNDEQSLYSNEHKAVRYKNRMKIIKKEMMKRINIVFFFSTIHYLIIFFVKIISPKEFMLVLVFNFMSLYFFTMVQFFLEIKFNSDAGFFVIIVLYITLVFVGMVMYDYCQKGTGTMFDFFEKINKFNIVNYSSLTRIRLMNCNVKHSLVTLVIVNSITSFFTLFGLKKSDIMKRG